MAATDLLRGLEAFFATVPRHRGDRLVVAFSGGGDSTALLWGLSRLAPSWELQLVAAHLDHGMDPGSAARRASAGRMARRLGVPLISARTEVRQRRQHGESLEAAARRMRYEFLHRIRRDLGARYVATAHHRDDQAETVLLRLAFGSGLRGLAGIRAIDGPLLRPLLTLPRSTLRRAVAAAGLEPAEDPSNADPRQPRSRMRHHILPALAAADAGEAAATPPAAASAAPGIVPQAAGERAEPLAALLGRVATRAARAAAVLDRRVAAEIGLPAISPAAASPSHPRRCRMPAASAAPLKAPAVDIAPVKAPAVDAGRLTRLAPPLLPTALSLLHRQAGAPYPASARARRELAAQLDRRAATAATAAATAAATPATPTSPAITAGIACDCGRGWRWQADDRGRILVERARAARSARADCIGGPEPAPAFTYTLEVPGTLTIPEIAVAIRLRVATVEPWMWRGSPWRAALALPAMLAMPATSPAPATATSEPDASEAGVMTAAPESTLSGWTVRTRRPGDRLRPLGAPGHRKLKDVLIDRGVARGERARLPLLCWGDTIAWVPGVTIDERFRLADGARTALVAETFRLPARTSNTGESPTDF